LAQYNLNFVECRKSDYLIQNIYFAALWPLLPGTATTLTHPTNCVGVGSRMLKNKLKGDKLVCCEIGEQFLLPGHGLHQK
jgi:hypothetical protein